MASRTDIEADQSPHSRIAMLENSSYACRMEHFVNEMPAAASAHRPGLAGRAYGTVRASDRLTPSHGIGERPATRADGWTPDRMRTFLHALAECGVVADAARAAGMSKQSAYAFRNSARGRGFDAAWRTALLLARRRLGDELLSRALNGCVEVIMRDGEVWGERHRYDNRLSMAVLARLDRLAESASQFDEAPRRNVHEFEAFVDCVCEGNASAADFTQSRADMPYRAFNEAAIIARNEEHVRAEPPGDEEDVQPSPPPEGPDLESASGTDEPYDAAEPAVPDPSPTSHPETDSAPGRFADGDASLLSALARLLDAEAASVAGGAADDVGADTGEPVVPAALSLGASGSLAAPSNWLEAPRGTRLARSARQGRAARLPRTPESREASRFDTT